MLKHETIKEILIDSLKELTRKDTILILNRSKEESINHRLAVYIENELNRRIKGHDLNVDVEYNKHYENDKTIEIANEEIRIRPDILIHKRISSDNNILIVEAKKDAINAHDRNKAMKLLEHPYSYLSAALISYRPDWDHIQLSFITSIGEEHLEVPKLSYLQSR